MIKNHTKTLRLDLNLNERLEKATEGMNLKESILLRFLIHDGLSKLEAEKVKSGNWKELTISYALK